MKQERRTTRFTVGPLTPLMVLWFAACTTPNPNYRSNSDGGDAAMCTANEPLRCDGDTLKRCNADGTAEVSEPCSLGCNSANLRCADVSNGLAKYFDMANGQMEFNLGDSATMNTDTGDVIVGGSSAPRIFSENVTQPNGPDVRVFVVKSLVAKDVTISGKKAFALVSSGEIKITGLFTASAKHEGVLNPSISGPGAFPDGNCTGQAGSLDSEAKVNGGAGGGGFGAPGGAGGSARNSKGLQNGAIGGSTTGNPELIPLRGGCGSGNDRGGAGGGAIQLVSRTQITVTGILAANGGSAHAIQLGGGSGGGILLEAPIVDVAGGVAANGAAGGLGGGFGGAEDGRLDAVPAKGDRGGAYLGQEAAQSGDGGAGNFGATSGSSIDVRPSDTPTSGGSGGGGVGRIRVNTSPGGLRGTGVFSPPPSQGAFASQ